MALPDLSTLTDSDPPHYLRIVLPRWQDRVGYMVLPWLTENRRGAWYTHHATTRRWRLWAYTRAVRLGLGEPPETRSRVVAELRFSMTRRRDPNNWSSIAKAALDGLVDAKVFRGDDRRYVIGPDMREGIQVPKGQSEELIMHIWRQK